MGTGDYQHIVSVLERVQAGERVNQVSPVPTFVADEHLPRYRTTSEAVAYLKVAEGCDYRCAFCIIPKLLGLGDDRFDGPGTLVAPQLGNDAPYPLSERSCRR